jgi:carbon-monoxide dehydrogenase medium subunit
MKASSFRYVRPQTLDEALEVLARYGDDARLLAGGQSLLPSLALRLSAPAVLVDIGRLSELQGIQETADGIRIGATVRHAQVEHSTQVQQCAPLLFQAMPWVAHPPIRARGTYGGSVSLSDPAAEAPAATLAHAATLVVRSSRGERRIAADDFFLGLYQTALEPGEILVGAHFKRPGPNERFVFREFARRSGDFATAGVAIQAVMDKARVQSARIVLFGVADRATLATHAAAALADAPLDTKTIHDAAHALAQDVEPFADTYHDSNTKMHLLRVLLRRSLLELGGQHA